MKLVSILDRAAGWCLVEYVGRLSAEMTENRSLEIEEDGRDVQQQRETDGNEAGENSI